MHHKLDFANNTVNIMHTSNISKHFFKKTHKGNVISSQNIL